MRVVQTPESSIRTRPTVAARTRIYILQPLGLESANALRPLPTIADFTWSKLGGPVFETRQAGRQVPNEQVQRC
jgi:hypothetical protein